jgi:hypothetical protein
MLVYSPAIICPSRIGPYLGFLGQLVMMYNALVAGVVAAIFGAGAGQSAMRGVKG